MIEHLEVRLWGRVVGVLASYVERYRDKALFYFDSEFLDSGYDIFPLRAPLSMLSLRKGAPVFPDDGKLFCGLPSFIADSLPDSWGERVFNRWAQANGIKSRHVTVLDRLAYTGRRGMGALEYYPPTAEDLERSARVEIRQLYEHSARIYSALETAEQPVTIKDMLTDILYRVGMSAGGKHPKAVININADSDECYSGQVAPPDDSFVPCIIKFDEDDDVPFTRLEYSYCLMAQEMGLTMMPSRMICQDEACHFVTQRFDRSGRKKIHAQTLAAMYPAAESYEALFYVISKLRLTPAEREQAFLAMVANVVTGNVDDHSKNFSFIMTDDGKWHLAPAYDYTFTVNTKGKRWDNGHSMTINGKASTITADDLLQIGRENSIRNAQGIINTVVAVAEHYDTFAREAGIDGLWLETVTGEIASRIHTLCHKSTTPYNNDESKVLR